MSNEHVRVPWTWAFRGFHIVLSLAIGYGVLWIRNDIRSELSYYVTRAEFDAYQQAHNKWGEEVVRRLQQSVDENNRRLDRIEAKMDRLVERRAALPAPNAGANAKPVATN